MLSRVEMGHMLIVCIVQACDASRGVSGSRAPAFTPTHPFASTREHAVVGVAGAPPIPNQLIRFIPDLFVAPNEAFLGVGVTPIPTPAPANTSTLGVIIVNVNVDGVHAV